MYDFKEIEDFVAKKWKKNQKEIKKTLQHDSKKPLYSFLEGPPTANSPPGLHHVEVRVFKDLFCKFKYMQGFSVPRKGGWDCHGLPVEVQIEKALQLESKKDVIDYGIGKFNKKARESVFSYIEDWNKLTEKMAYWVDLENPYVTMDNDYIESIWWSLKELHKKKMLYEGHKVVPFCPRCETPLSSHEVSQGYKDTTEPTATIKLKIKDSTNRFILVWTTTPWTLPSNLAVAVNPKTRYVVVKQNDEELTIAKDLVNKHFEDPEIVEEFSGKDMEGLKYDPPFKYFLDKKNSFRIIMADFVTTDEGTGLVHMAPAFGEDDYKVCKENKIDFVQPITSNGKFTDEIPEYKGMFVKKADPQIIEDLDAKKILFKKEHYTHTYPYCWRCNSPLIYFAMLSWFVRVSSIKNKLIENNNKITWTPKHIKDGRFGKWLENAKDWALSRSRFWGTPIPIWRSEDGDEICIGSIKELEQLSGKQILDLHKPEIDEIIIKKGKKEYKRVPDVIDTWYDSGSATFAQYHYPFENEEMTKKSITYDFISEAIDQTRGWFYTLHILSTILFDKPAYKNVVCAGHILDEKGEKMSKSKGNILDPWEMFDTVGVDAVRLQMCANAPGDSKRFSIALVNQQISPFLRILWNCYQYMNIVNKNNTGEQKVEDTWILSRLSSLTKELTERLENHSYHHGLSILMNFVNEDLSRWYIKIVRDRDDSQVHKTLQEVFQTLTKLLAPFAPYLSEYIYKDFKEKESVHFEEWPKSEKINKELEINFDILKEIVQQLLSKREEAKIGVRWPLSSVIINTTKPKELEPLSEIIKNMINVKEVVFKKGELSTELNTNSTPELESEGFTREITRKIQNLRKKLKLQKQDKIKLTIFTSENILNKEEIKEKVNAPEFEITPTTKPSKADINALEKVKDKEFEIFISKL